MAIYSFWNGIITVRPDAVRMLQASEFGPFFTPGTRQYLASPIVYSLRSNELRFAAGYDRLPDDLVNVMAYIAAGSPMRGWLSIAYEDPGEVRVRFEGHKVYYGRRLVRWRTAFDPSKDLLAGRPLAGQVMPDGKKVWFEPLRP